MLCALRTWVIVLMLLLSSQIGTLAQIPFFSESAVPMDQLNSSQASMLSAFQSESDVVSATIMRIRNLQAEGSAESIYSLNLPHYLCTALINFTSADVHSDGSLYVSGVFESADTSETNLCPDGDIAILGSGEIWTGYIHTYDEIYQIEPLGGGLHVLLELGPENGYHCGGDVQDSTNISPQQGGLEPRSCSESVRLLAVYTDRGEAKVSDIRATIQLAISSTKSAMTRSGVSIDDLHLELVGIERIAYNNDLRNFEQNLNDLTLSAEVDSLRSEYSADIVVAFVGTTFELNGQSDYGLAWSTLNSEQHVAVIRADRSTVNYGAAHEIGHLFGCGHEDGRDVRPDARAKEFKISWKKRLFNRKHRTLMWSDADENRIVGHYSNPTVEYRDAATGDADRNNANQLIDAACILAAHRPYDPPSALFDVKISGETETCACFFTTLEASLSGNNSSSVSYEWSVSENGIKFSDPISTDSQVSIPNDCVVQDYFVRLVVTNQVGEVLVRIVRVESVDSQDGTACPLFLNGEMPSSTYFEINPIVSSFSVVHDPLYRSWKVLRNGRQLAVQTVEVHVHDVLGRVLYRTDLVFDTNNSNVVFNLPQGQDLADGIYFANVVESGRIYSTIVNIKQ